MEFQIMVDTYSIFLLKFDIYSQERFWKLSLVTNKFFFE